MATSGRAWLVALVVGLAAVGGCSSATPGTSPTTAAPAAPAAVPGTPDASAPPSSASTPDRGLTPCRVDLPVAWSSALRHGVVAPKAHEVLTVALGTADGSVFAVSDVPGVRHALVWRRGGADTVVQDFGLDHPEWQVLGATFDGRHLAYRVDRSYANLEDFALYVWDSRGSKAPVEIAHGERDRDGALMQSPFVDPVLARGWVYWTQTRDADPGHTVLSGYRLEDGHVERLSRGFGRAPVRFGGSLVWADSDRAGQTSRLRAVDLTSHRRVALPTALAGVRGLYYLAGDAGTLAWVSGGHGQDLSVWRPGWPRPRLLLQDRDAPQFPRIAGETVVFGDAEATFAADLRSWSSARLTPAYGGVYADGGPVIGVGYAPASKTAASVQALLDTDAAGPLGRVGC